MPDPACCAWCGGPLKFKRRLCCSADCSERWIGYGKGASRRQVEARLTHLAQQPMGCETVEAFIAAGGTVYREP